MKTVSFAEASKDLKTVLDDVCNDAGMRIITQHDSKDVVALSLNYYNSLMETIHLLRSPENTEHLNRSIAQFKAGKVTQRDLLDE